MKKWNEIEEKYLENNYPISSIPIEDICKHLKRSYDSVMKKAQRMFLKREVEQQNTVLPLDTSNIEEHSFFTETYKSSLKNKLFVTTSK